MKPPVEYVKVSAMGREVLIQAKRHTGMKQWNELLRWAFCISMANPDPPKVVSKLDAGIEPIEWMTFAGAFSQAYSAAFYIRANVDGVNRSDSEALAHYFRAHIERGVASLRSLKSLHALLGVLP
jgi:DNA sulfur modification protein DndE